MQSNEIERRKLILYSFAQNPEASGSSIAKMLKMPKSTVNGVIKRYKDSLTIDRKPGSGGKSRVANKKLVKGVALSFRKNPGLSNRDRARKFKVSESYIRKLKSSHGYNSYSVIKHPNRNDKADLLAKRLTRKLYNKTLTKTKGCIIMDDETYVKCDFKQLPACNFYVSTMRGNVPNRFKFVLQDKFAKKMMVWQALCSCGRKSKGFVTTSTMDRHMYINECLQKRLLPLIKSHRTKPTFWPDSATIHYANDTLGWYKANKVAYIAKDGNPKNCPHLRPIEKYWAIVKRKLNKAGGAAKDVKQMYGKWNKAAATVTPKGVQALMGSINKHARDFYFNKE